MDLRGWILKKNTTHGVPGGLFREILFGHTSGTKYLSLFSSCPFFLFAHTHTHTERERQRERYKHANVPLRGEAKLFLYVRNPGLAGRVLSGDMSKEKATVRPCLRRETTRGPHLMIQVIEKKKKKRGTCPSFFVPYPRLLTKLQVSRRGVPYL
ncbi:hypothetical protein LY76DRAFT_349830 [Colletotrichum caudatum]|nr:hypothetical protein LY76DRAFT_349830 [Colletotrichum caudatum]